MKQSSLKIPVGTATVTGDLILPETAIGIVIFAHGSGSSRFSTRNRYVASELEEANLGTFLLDLLTKDEDRIDQLTAEYRFNIPLLADRLDKAATYLKSDDKTSHFQLGYFGASTGAAAALIAAAKKPELIKAVVSRGGRPDLAGEFLTKVKAPTLLIVGEIDDARVIDWNRKALEKIPAVRRLEMVPRRGIYLKSPALLSVWLNWRRTGFRHTYLNLRVRMPRARCFP